MNIQLRHRLILERRKLQSQLERYEASPRAAALSQQCQQLKMLISNLDHRIAEFDKRKKNPQE